MENMYTGKSSRNPNKPMIISLIIGVFLIALGIYLYYDLAAWETSTEEKRLHRIIWAVYDIGGKIGVAGFLSVLGAIVMVSGILETKKLKKIVKDHQNRQH